MKNPPLASSIRLSQVSIVAFCLCCLWPRPAKALNPLWSKGGHASRVSGVACSQDGTVLASASDDFTVKLWSTNGTLLRTLNTAPAPATSLALSPDGTKLAIGTYFGGVASGNVGRFGYSSIPGIGLVYLWQAPDGWTSSNVGLVRVYTNKSGKITTLAFSADSSRLAWGNAAGSNIVCSVTSASVLATRPGYNISVGPAAVTSVALSASGWLLSGCEDNTLRLWNSAWAQVWNSTSSHSSNVTSVAFSPDGASFVSASLDGTLRLWSTNGTLLGTLSGHETDVTAVAFGPDGTQLASGSADGRIKLWDPAAGTCLATISAHRGAVTSLAFTPDSTHVLSGGEDACVRLWSSRDGALVQNIGWERGYIGVVSFSPDGKLCASAGGGSGISVHRSADGSPVVTLPGHTGFVSALAFAPDSSILASGGGPLEPTIKLWRLSDGALVRTITPGTNGVLALAFSPDGNLLASGADCTEQTISLWAVATGALVRSLAGHTNGVTALAFSPDSNLLASGGRRFDQAVKIWAVKDGALLSSLIGHTNNVDALAFSPDGKLVASGSSGVNNLRVWQLSNGSFRSFGTGTNPVLALGFSPGGTNLASAERDTIRFWSVQTGELSETATQETFRVSCLAFSPNGNLFLIGREDATVVLYANTRGALDQAPLTFLDFTPPSSTGAAFAASVQPWTRYVIQSSTNLVDWEFVVHATSAGNSLLVTNLTLTNPQGGFIRALTPP
jgi:WD40 repeat protein